MDRAETAVSPEETARLKGLGFLRDKRYPDVFNVRVVTRAGRLTAAQLRAVGDAAETYGSGEVALTTRQTVELQGVPYARVEALTEALRAAGLEPGGTGPRVRPVVACKGTSCTYGLIDTRGLSQAIHERFYVGWHGVKLPHKFKIAVGGCPNNCVKPELNDLGIVGWRLPQPDASRCRRCGVCAVEKACPMGAARVAGAEGLRVDPALCRACGRCVGKCPFGVTAAASDGFRLYLGGRWGKKTAVGRPLGRIYTSEDAVLEAVERILVFYRDHGLAGERFADTLARLGFAAVEAALTDD